MAILNGIQVNCDEKIELLGTIGLRDTEGNYVPLKQIKKYKVTLRGGLDPWFDLALGDICEIMCSTVFSTKINTSREFGCVIEPVSAFSGKEEIKFKHEKNMIVGKGEFTLLFRIGFKAYLQHFEVSNFQSFMVFCEI